MASMWCEKCNKITYGKKCDFCGYENKDNSKTYTLPKTQKVKLTNETKRKEKQEINLILYIPLLIIAISIAYLAINKYQERQEIKKAFKYMSGTENIEDYTDMSLEERVKLQKNSKLSKEINQIIGIEMKNMENLFKK